jgi:hypothetical protein
MNFFWHSLFQEIRRHTKDTTFTEILAVTRETRL